jgi:hypothetical protein
MREVDWVGRGWKERAVATNPEGPDAQKPSGGMDAGETTPEAAPAERSPRKGPRRVKKSEIHQVTFVTYPKLLFVWPLILAGLVFAPFSSPDYSPPAVAAEVADAADASQLAEQAAEGAIDVGEPADSETSPASPRLEMLGWIYILILFIVVLTLGVDVDRNQFIFWVVLILGCWIGGRYLAVVKGFTLFGDIYKWFAWLDVQYNRSFGLTLSIILLVPYLIMIGWAYLNDRWRITHNEFEHYSLGKMDDSLGRGAKTIRTSFPDVLELILGLAGTLIVYNATGTRELRRIPHVMFLPFVRKRLNTILERTAVTAAQMEEEEEDEDDI